MSQHDYNIAAQPLSAFRADLNRALAAIVSLNSGATEPAPSFAYQLWADTTTGLLKIRDAVNPHVWIPVGPLASANFGNPVLHSVQYPTSGTIIDFTGIPAGATKLEFVIHDLALAGADALGLQLGSAGVFETSGYSGDLCTRVLATLTPVINGIGGFQLEYFTYNYTRTLGIITLYRGSGNTWHIKSEIYMSPHNISSLFIGAMTTGAALDRLRFFTLTSTAFTAGSVALYCSKF